MYRQKHKEKGKKSMKTSIKIAVIVAALAALAAQAGSLTIGGGNKYVLRGKTFNDESVAQATLDAPIGSNGFGVIVWENADLTDYEGARNKASEIDIIGHWAHDIGASDSIDLGVGQYSYPNIKAESTAEAYATVTDRRVVPVTLGAWWDFATVGSTYIQLSVNPTWSVSKRVTLGAIASAGMSFDGYNEYYFGTRRTAMNDVVGKATVAVALTDRLTLSADAGYMWLPDGAIADGAKAIYGRDSAPLADAAVSYSF